MRKYCIKLMKVPHHIQGSTILHIVIKVLCTSHLRKYHLVHEKVLYYTQETTILHMRKLYNIQESTTPYMRKFVHRT